MGLAASAIGGITSGVWGSVLTGAVAGAAGGFAAGFSGTLLYGGSLSDAFENGLIGAAWGGVAGAIGGYINAGAWAALSKALAHGVTGSVLSLAQGGSWETGFLAGFGAGMVSGYMAGANIVLKTIAAALVGGTASAMGGGKFANGAVTGAVALLVGAGLKKLGELHYRRNARNEANLDKIGMGDTGLTSDVLEKGDVKFTRSKYMNKIFHDRGHSGNQRWSVKSGEYAGTEIIVDLNGNRVFDALNSESFNYSTGNIATHFLTDMLPYYPFGNSPQDPSTFVERFLRNFEGPRRRFFGNPAAYGQ